MNQQEKIQALEARLNRLTQPKEVSMTNQLINEELESVRVDVSRRVSTRALEKLNTDFAELKNTFDLKPVFDSIANADSANKAALKALESSFVRQVSEVLKEVKKEPKAIKELVSQINQLRISLAKETEPLIKRDILLSAEIDRVSQELRRIGLIVSDTSKADEALRSSEEAKERIKDLTKRVNSGLTELQNNRGGNMNRQVLVNGNTSTLGLYTDMNLISGTGVTISPVANLTTQRTDITISATGGSGGTSFASVSGTVNGSNQTFGYPSDPQAIIGDGITYFENNGFTFAASVITMSSPPSQYIKAIV